MILAMLYPCILCLNPTNRKASTLDVQHILQLALDRAVGSDNKYRLSKLPPQISKSDFIKHVGSTSDYASFLNFRDSLKSLLDTATLHVVVGANYYFLTEWDKQSVHRASVLVKKDEGVDALFLEALSNLVKDDSLHSDQSVPPLTTNHNYKLLRYYSAFGVADDFDKLRRIGSISFSRVAFNHSYNRACVYTTFVCGTLCGYGRVHFLKRVNDEWNYIASYHTWVS